MLWVEKYRPKSLKDVEGHNNSISELKSFIQNYKKGAILLYGRYGSGKTCTVYALANDLNIEILEVNASDVRDKERINSIIGQSSKQVSLFKKGKIILIDEIDALSGQKDRGCIQALSKIISESIFPVILTAENPYDKKLSGLRRYCKLVDFSDLSSASVFNILRKVCNNENVKYDEFVLKDLATRSDGDARAAINDLQIICATKKVLESLDELGEREKKGSIINALKLIFKSKNPLNVLDAFEKTDLNLDECLLWLDENLPKEYKGYDLLKAYDCVSKSDVFKGRIMRWQHWRFLVYINALLTAGVSVSKIEKNPYLIDYKPTSRILKIWKAKMRNAKRNAIAEKIAKKTHTSTKKVLDDTLPYLKFVFEKKKGQDMIDELELNEDEVNWLIS